MRKKQTTNTSGSSIQDSTGEPVAGVPQSAASGKWRIGHKVPLNVYKGDYPVCQCHTPQEALEIVDGMNVKDELYEALEAAYEQFRDPNSYGNVPRWWIDKAQTALAKARREGR